MSNKTIYSAVFLFLTAFWLWILNKIWSYL